MPIGRFARSCRLSVKALRHYDELGLLHPAFVDPRSGYRYYAREQAHDAVMIGMLRSLDLPLAVVQRALAAEPDELKELINAEAVRIGAELAARKRALLSLNHIAERGSLAPASIEVHEEPSRRVARITIATDAEHLIDDTTLQVRALIEDIEVSALELREPLLTINDVSETDSRITVHACAEIAGEAEGLRRAEIVELPGGPFAFVHHVGPYETLGLAHHALFAWVQEHGHESTGPIWEFYRNDPDEVRAEALVTDVGLPLARESV